MLETVTFGYRASNNVLQYATGANEEGKMVYTKVAEMLTGDYNVFINDYFNRLTLAGFSFLNGTNLKNMYVLKTFQTQYDLLNLYTTQARRNTIASLLNRLQLSFQTNGLPMRQYINAYFGRTMLPADVERVCSNKKLGYYPLMSNAYDGALYDLSTYVQAATILDRTLYSQRLVGFKDDVLFGATNMKDNVLFADSNVILSIMTALKGTLAAEDIMVNDNVRDPALVLDLKYFQNGMYRDAQVTMQILKFPNGTFESLGTLATILRL